MSVGYSQDSKHLEELARVLYSHVKGEQVFLREFTGVLGSKKQAKRDMDHFLKIGIVQQTKTGGYVLTDDAEGKILKNFPEVQTPSRDEYLEAIYKMLAEISESEHYQGLKKAWDEKDVERIRIDYNEILTRLQGVETEIRGRISESFGFDKNIYKNKTVVYVNKKNEARFRDVIHTSEKYKKLLDNAIRDRLPIWQEIRALAKMRKSLGTEE